MGMYGSNRAEAALRLTLNSGAAPTQQFFSATNALLASTAIDGYTVVLDTVLTNFPGATAGGTLTTTTSFSTDGGTISDLIVLAEVVVSPDAASGLATFTKPAGTTLNLVTDVTGVPGNSTSGTVTGRSTANGTNIDAGPISIPGIVETANAGTFAGPLGYTLTNLTTISGVNQNADSVAVTLSSKVTATPEPATLVVAFTGLPLLGIGAWLRNRRKATALPR